VTHQTDNFLTSSDLPFTLRGGESQEIALYNRIAAINRIEYLVRKEVPEFNLRDKSKDFIRCLDLEMYIRFYNKEPKNKVIDEEFCQRSAEICLEMEKAVIKEETAQPAQKETTPQKPPTLIDKILQWVKK